MPCHAPLNHSGGNHRFHPVTPNTDACWDPGGLPWQAPMLPCRARRTGPYLRGARRCRACRTSPPLPRTGCLRPALREAQRAFASPQVRHFPARCAQDINARVGLTLPETVRRLKRKAARDCEHRVEDRDCLWITLENAGETAILFCRPLKRAPRRLHRLTPGLHPRLGSLARCAR
jgi:hypothetical protein